MIENGGPRFAVFFLQVQKKPRDSGEIFSNLAAMIREALF